MINKASYQPHILNIFLITFIVIVIQLQLFLHVNNKKTETPHSPQTNEKWINKELIETALFKQKNYGMAVIQLINSGFTEMTKSWLCNVNQISTKVIPRLIIIATDEKVQKELQKFKTNTGINYDIILHKCGFNSSLKYGDYEYYEMMLARLKIQNELVQAGVSIFMVESDATWFTNGDIVIDEFHELLQVNDMVTTNDCKFRQSDCVSCGFMAFKNSIAMQKFFQNFLDEYTKYLLSKNGTRNIGDAGSEQLFLMEILKNPSNITNITWTYASDERYSSGNWYNDIKMRTNDILVVQNNWNIGIQMKMDRAKSWNHWFSDGRVCLKHVNTTK